MTTVKAHARKTKKGQVRVKAHSRKASSALPPKPTGKFKKFEPLSKVVATEFGEILIAVTVKWNPIVKAYEFFYALTDVELDPYGMPVESEKGFKSVEGALRRAKKELKIAVERKKEYDKMIWESSR